MFIKLEKVKKIDNAIPSIQCNLYEGETIIERNVIMPLSNTLVVRALIVAPNGSYVIEGNTLGMAPHVEWATLVNGGKNLDEDYKLIFNQVAATILDFLYLQTTLMEKEIAAPSVSFRNLANEPDLGHFIQDLLAWARQQ